MPDAPAQPERNRCIPVAEASISDLLIEASSRCPSSVFIAILPSDDIDAPGEVRTWFKGHVATLLGLNTLARRTIVKQSGI